MVKKDKNGKSVSGKVMKKADNGICSDCNYKIKEETVDQKKVKEKDVFDKPKSKKDSNQNRKKKTRRPKK